jgi:hypothetical protein
MASSSQLAGVLLLIIGVIGVGFGIFYFTTDTSFLASDFGRHYTHAAGATVLGLIFVIVGIFLVRKKPVKPKPSLDLTKQEDKTQS